jgi:hypothetical protein
MSSNTLHQRSRRVSIRFMSGMGQLRRLSGSFAHVLNGPKSRHDLGHPSSRFSSAPPTTRLLMSARC